MSKTRRLRLRSILTAPVMLALITVLGLVIALTGDGMRDAASWAALGVPVLTIVWAMKMRRA